MRLALLRRTTYCMANTLVTAMTDKPGSKLAPISHLICQLLFLDPELRTVCPCIMHYFECNLARCLLELFKFRTQVRHAGKYVLLSIAKPNKSTIVNGSFKDLTLSYRLMKHAI